MNQIIKYHFISLTRFEIAKYRIAPEYIALIFTIFLFSTIILGLSVENPIYIEKFYFINLNYLTIYIFVVPIFLDAFMKASYTPNYIYLKLVFPFNLIKFTIFDFLFEFLSFKFIIPLSVLLLISPFIYYYQLNFEFGFIIKGLLLIFLTYSNSCLLINVIKNTMKDKSYIFHKNLIRFIFIFLAFVIVYNENVEILPLSDFKTTSLFLNFSIIGFIVLYFINLFILVKSEKL